MSVLGCARNYERSAAIRCHPPAERSPHGSAVLRRNICSYASVLPRAFIEINVFVGSSVNALDASATRVRRFFSSFSFLLFFFARNVPYPPMTAILIRIGVEIPSSDVRARQLGDYAVSDLM